MELLIANISPSKPIGIGPVTILPGESKAIPETYANHPSLKLYEEKGFIRVSRIGPAPVPVPEKTAEALAAEKAEAEAREAEAAENLRKSRLASLKGISDEALGKLAQELGINPADCKDSADMLKKVKAALK